jgi:hypothetical protein
MDMSDVYGTINILVEGENTQRLERHSEALYDPDALDKHRTMLGNETFTVLIGFT